MKKHTLLRKIYLYLFALLGLVLLTIGSVNFVNMGLKVFVFTKAEDQQKIEYSRPISDPMFIGEKKDIILNDNTKQVDLKLTEAQTSELKYFLNNKKLGKKDKMKLIRLCLEDKNQQL